MITAVCLKWVDRRPEVDDPIDAGAAPDSRFAGVSAADQAALEWALRSRECVGGSVVAVTVGPPGADAVLRDACAAGADRAVRIDAAYGAASRATAGALARALAGARWIWCGDYSFDRGTGSVPAFIAHELGIAQALGLVQVDLPNGNDTTSITALRRLDGGRRERLTVAGPAVLSVEGSTALLRRAPLRSLLRPAVIDVVTGEADLTAVVAAESRPYRPRPRALAPPAGETALDRVRALTSAGAAAPARGETVVLEPGAAAERILAALSDWGYLP